MENKNIRTFCGRKPSQKKPNKSNNSNNIRPHQNVTDSYKQSVEPLNKPQDTQNIKRYKDNKLWRKLFYRH